MTDKEIIAVFHYDEERMRSASEPYTYREDIVRCRECKHWRNEHICMAWSRYGTIETKADDFCSYGVRKESE